jgi:hypothetical protein
MFYGSLLLRDRSQHVARARDVRQVDLGFDLLFAISRTRRRFCRTRRRVGTAAEMFPHQIRLEVFQGTGVRFLLRDTHRSQHVKNFLAFDL